ncbi:LLM class flavin-dependent oxidoreductase [uncultured Cellulomonas sp.]|uniref:LLM class flavin-dependent oxidoreductase n=1 Tax=uncultured Cellulomonas sp. TaxID=189682 RepID=UPI0028ECE061|nr:LLM class flavin-dependent oxidoreductase [uncultured Cellulomonas sp.]
MTTSVQLPFVPRKVEQVVPFAALVENGPAQRLWQGHSMVVDALHGFAAAAGAGFRVPTGLGVGLLPFRHPLDAAHQVRSLALATGQPVVAGFGPAAPQTQAALRGEPYRSPLTACREYVEIVRGLLAGEHVERAGEYFTCDAQMVEVPAPPVEVGLGVLRAGMARLAGEVADVAITWLTPPDYLRDVLVPALTEGAAAAGRPAPRVVAIVPVALGRDSHGPVDVLLAGNGPHLQAAHYADMLRRAGVAHDPSDLPLTARRVVESGVLLHGDVEDVAAGVARYRDAGVDEVVLNTTGVCRLVGARDALADCRALVDALA